KAATGYHLWSETYDRDLKDVFAVQDEISKAIVRSLRMKLASGMDTTKLMRPGTSDMEAHSLVLKGLFALNEKTPASIRQATTYFQQAIARDSTYAAAYADLGYAYWYAAYRRVGPPDDYYPRSEAVARHA